MSKLIIFDTETTGLEKEDRIIQVGAIIKDIKNASYKVEVHDDLCSSNVNIKIEAMATHGIREKQLKGKPSFMDTDFFKKLQELNVDENYLVAHNLDFDLAMLKKEGFKNNLKLIDTLQCAKHLYDYKEKINGYELPNYKLQTFRYILFSQKTEEEEATKYGVEIRAHDAIGDVVILTMFLRELYKKVSQDFSLKDPIDIMDRMVALTKMPIPPNKVILMFGKHQGKSVEEVDSGWLDWYAKTDNPQKDIVVAIKELNKNKNSSESINF